jgi:hypothetical protein
MGADLNPDGRMGSYDAQPYRLGVADAQEQPGCSHPEQRMTEQDIFSLLDGFAY